MANIDLPSGTQVTRVKNCGCCHECTAPLTSAGEDAEEEWCPRCCEQKVYSSHGYGGMGDGPEFCPWVDVQFTNRGHEVVTARGSRDGRRLLYERHQPRLLPIA
jgi:hypothetical protein